MLKHKSKSEQSQRTTSTPTAETSSASLKATAPEVRKRGKVTSHKTTNARLAKGQPCNHAAALFRRFGLPIGVDALKWAIDRFEPCESSFDKSDHLTLGAAREIYRIMGKKSFEIFDTVGGHLTAMTRDDFNVLRDSLGMPPIKLSTRKGHGDSGVFRHKEEVGKGANLKPSDADQRPKCRPEPEAHPYSNADDKFLSPSRGPRPLQAPRLVD